MSSSLRAADISLAYGPLRVVHGACLSLNAGRVLALVGPNGSGKSTLLRGIARLHGLAEGALHLEDSGANPVDAALLTPRAFATKLAMLTQQRPTPAGMTVREVVALGRHPHKTRWFGADAAGPDAIERAMALAHVTELVDRPVDELSGGQLQRVWLASCLAQRTPVLLLDEPTNHLDLRHQAELLDLIRELADQHHVAVGVVLHDLNHAAAVADDVALLIEGHIDAVGTPKQVLTEGRLARAYGVPIEVREVDGVLQVRPLPKCLTRHRLNTDLPAQTALIA